MHHIHHWGKWHVFASIWCHIALLAEVHSACHITTARWVRADRVQGEVGRAHNTPGEYGVAHTALGVDVAVADGRDKSYVRRQGRELCWKLKVELERPRPVDGGVGAAQHHLQASRHQFLSRTPTTSSIINLIMLIMGEAR